MSDLADLTITQTRALLQSKEVKRVRILVNDEYTPFLNPSLDIPKRWALALLRGVKVSDRYTYSARFDPGGLLILIPNGQEPEIS